MQQLKLFIYSFIDKGSTLGQFFAWGPIDFFLCSTLASLNASAFNVFVKNEKIYILIERSGKRGENALLLSSFAQKCTWSSHFISICMNTLEGALYQHTRYCSLFIKRLCVCLDGSKRFATTPQLFPSHKYCRWPSTGAK